VELPITTFVWRPEHCCAGGDSGVNRLYLVANWRASLAYRKLESSGSGNRINDSAVHRPSIDVSHRKSRASEVHVRKEWAFGARRACSVIVCFPTGCIAKPAEGEVGRPAPSAGTCAERGFWVRAADLGRGDALERLHRRQAEPLETLGHGLLEFHEGLVAALGGSGRLAGSTCSEEK